MLRCKDTYLAQYPDLETVYRLQNNKLEPVLIKELENGLEKENGTRNTNKNRGAN